MDKVAKLKLINGRIAQMKQLCNNWGIRMKGFNPRSYRLTKPGYGTIDVFPKSMRCFWHDDEEWGDVTNIKAFLKFEFKTKPSI